MSMKLCLKNKLPFFLLAVILLAACSCTGPDSEASLKKSAISSFYSIITTRGPMGIPDAGDSKRLSPYISADFRSLLAKGMEAEKKYAAASKEPVPPMIEGSLFVSLFEGAVSFGAITPEGGNGNSFLVELTYRDRLQGQHEVRWKDRVVLIKENRRWVIDDIELLGKWDFGRKGSVKHILHEVIKDAGMR
jgi:hypothetical protein